LAWSWKKIAPPLYQYFIERKLFPNVDSIGASR